MVVNQRGFSLIEALVTMVIVALAMIGHLTLQNRTVVTQQSTHFQSVAVSMINDLSERMAANATGVANGSYNTGGGFISTVTAPAKDCSTADDCSDDELAAYDLSVWYTRVSSIIPGVAFEILYPDATRTNQVQITVGWDANRSGVTVADCSDAGVQCVVMVRVL